jgi:hypothetical protein
MKTIYMQLKAISAAKKWPESYMTDLTDFDRKFLRECRTGDQMVWMLRRCGTHIHHTAKSCHGAFLRDEPTLDLETFCKWARVNQDWVQSQHDQFSLGVWYLIHVEARHYGSVTPITPEEALRLTKYNEDATTKFYREHVERLAAVSR